MIKFILFFILCGSNSAQKDNAASNEKRVICNN